MENNPYNCEYDPITLLGFSMNNVIDAMNQLEHWPKDKFRVLVEAFGKLKEAQDICYNRSKKGN